MILEQFSLNGKVAIVTGASRGLGQGMAVGLAEAGADIVGVASGDMAETRKAVEALGRKFLPVQRMGQIQYQRQRHCPRLHVYR